MHIDITPMGDIVRSAREAKCLSQPALAKIIGVSKRTIIAVENNQRKPTCEVFCRLVHALDISADLIIYPDRVPYTAEQEQLFREFGLGYLSECWNTKCCIATCVAAYASDADLPCVFVGYPAIIIYKN